MSDQRNFFNRNRGRIVLDDDPAITNGTKIINRILFCSSSNYLDDSNGAAVATRAMMEALTRGGFDVEVLSGCMYDAGTDQDLGEWLSKRNLAHEELGSGSWSLDAEGVYAIHPRHSRLTYRGVPVVIHGRCVLSTYDNDLIGYAEFLNLLIEVFERFQPDVLINYGGDRLAHEIRSRARARGSAVVFALHNFGYTHTVVFETVDAVIVPSRFAAEHYRRNLGLVCQVLPNIVQVDRVRAAAVQGQFLTFVNPSHEKGVYAFARIADELGRRRPDIRILVVEGRGTERTLMDCGIDLRVHGNVSMMGNTPDPRQFWGVTKLCLMPSLWWENQPLVAIEAMINGIPVIGSDRGGIPETLGDAGVILPLPDRLTSATRELPTTEEVKPWVQAVIHLWDDPDAYLDRRDRALKEAGRWATDRLEPLYWEFFSEIRSGDPDRKSDREEFA